MTSPERPSGGTDPKPRNKDEHLVRNFAARQRLATVLANIDEAIAKEAVQNILGPILSLEGPRREELLRLIRIAVLDTPPIQNERSKAFGSHPRAVAAREAQVQELTGCDFSTPVDRMLLAVVITLFDANAEP